MLRETLQLLFTLVIPAGADILLVLYKVFKPDATIVSHLLFLSDVEKVVSLRENEGTPE